VGIEEPMWVYLSFQRRAHHKRRFAEHPVGTREITGLTLTTRMPLRSLVSQKIVEVEFYRLVRGTPLLEIEFDGKWQRKRTDFRPDLPFIFQMCKCDWMGRAETLRHLKLIAEV
jgi:hypothetical protein